MNTSKEWTKFCPKCEGKKVHEDLSETGLYGMQQREYYCEDCGYRGMFFPEKKN